MQLSSRQSTGTDPSVANRCLRHPMVSILIRLSGACFALASCATFQPKPLDATGSLRMPDGKTLQIQASQLQHPTLRPVPINLRDGVSPDEAAVLAVLLNPTLKADRDRRGAAEAQLITAGVLPNPQISYTHDFLVGSKPPDTVSAFGFGASWDTSQLVTLAPRLTAARQNAQAVDLDIAWNEWQTAQAARTSALRVGALTRELEAARQADSALAADLATVRKALESHDKTALDAAAAETASRDAHSIVLQLEKELASERLALNRAMGVPPDTWLPVQNAVLLTTVHPPDYATLVENLEASRLDLLGLKAGYDSQNAALRAAILAQIPKIGLGFNRAGDTSDVQTAGFGITLDVPLFDRNQGGIATETATRQKLFDEYNDRVFQARADIASALSNIKYLNLQVAQTSQAVRSLEALVDTASTALNQGNADAISVSQTRHDLIQKRIELLQLRQQLGETAIGLEIASGRYLSLF